MLVAPMHYLGSNKTEINRAGTQVRAHITVCSLSLTSLAGNTGPVALVPYDAVNMAFNLSGRTVNNRHEYFTPSYSARPRTHAGEILAVPSRIVPPLEVQTGRGRGRDEG